MITFADRHRRAIFWSLVTLFFATGGTVIFYALGLRFSVDRGIFIHTGSITLETNPAEIEVTLNGKPVPAKRLRFVNNSIHLGGERPGEYLMEISAPGFRPWSKKTVVQSGVSSEYWNVLLVRENYERFTLPATDATRIFPSSEANLLAAVRNLPNGLAVTTINTENSEVREIFSTPEGRFDSESAENIEWSPEAHKIIVPLLKQGTKEYVVVTEETGSTLVLNQQFPDKPIREVHFDPRRRDLIFFLSDSGLYQYDTANPAIPPRLLAQGIESYDLSGSFVYVLLRDTGLVYRFPNNNNTTPELFQITKNTPENFTVKNLDLAVYDEDRFFLLDRSAGRLFVYNLGKSSSSLWHTATDGIRGAQYSDDGKKLLFYTDFELSVLYTREWEVQPNRSENEIHQVARFSEPMKQVQWSNDYEHILFALGKTIKMIELDHRDHRNIADLLLLKRAPLQLYGSVREGRLYILESPETPESQNMFFITFPEPVGFFG